MTKEQLHAQYENCLNKDRLDQEIFDAIFKTPNVKPAFQDMERAKLVCQMHLDGWTHKHIGKQVGLSASYVGTIVHKTVRVYKRRMEYKVYQLEKTCHPTNNSHLLYMAQCAADNDPNGIIRFAKALLLIPDDLYDFPEEDRLAYMINWLHQECADEE